VTICFVLLLLLKAGLDGRRDEEPNAGSPDRPSYRRSIVLAACVVAGFSAMLRPANIAVVFALLVIWSIGAVRTKRLTQAEFLIVVLGLSIPCIPQLANNYRSFHKFQPLYVGGLHNDQLYLGTRFLKYGTIVIANQDPRLCYDNPFLRPGIAKPSEF